MTTREDLVQAVAAYRRAIRNLRTVANDLPPYNRFHQNRNGEPCGWEHDVLDGDIVTDATDKIVVDDGAGQVVTHGLAQFCSFTADEYGPHATTDGWDDMHMEGPSWIICDCGQVFCIPPDLNWD